MSRLIIASMYHLARELAEKTTPAGFATHTMFDLEKSTPSGVIRNAASEVGLTAQERDALLRRNVAELSRPENLEAVIKVFRCLADWRDQRNARTAVVDVSNPRRASLNKRGRL